MTPQGDCNLVGDVTGGTHYPAYNMTIRDEQVTIACGIISAIDRNGTSAPIDPGSSNVSMSVPLLSPGNQSADGSSGRYFAPLPESPFQSTLNSTNAVCMGGSGGNYCLPNGTYEQQKGSLGFDITQVNTLTLPQGSSLRLHLPSRARPGYAHALAAAPTYSRIVVYSTNQTAANGQFARDVEQSTVDEDYFFDVLVPQQPDCVCFFQQTSYQGDVQCFGPGGGDLPPALQGQVGSVIAHGDAAVEIFAGEYGFKDSMIIDTAMNDLTKVKYDNTTSFSEKAQTMFIYLEPAAGS